MRFTIAGRLGSWPKTKRRIRRPFSCRVGSPESMLRCSADTYRWRREFVARPPTTRSAVLCSRLRPHFQHSENCPSMFSPQSRQRQGFLTDSKGARVFLRIASASASSSSRTTQSSGQQSMGGSSPAALERSRFRVTQRISNVERTFFRWPTIRGSLAL